MANSTEQPQGSTVSSSRNHERTDVRAGWIFGIVLFLAVSGVAIHFMMARMLNSLKHKAPTTDQWQPFSQPSAQAKLRPVFPRLQISPPVEMEAFRAREEAELNSYGWLNKTAGIVHIPIEQAMELLLQKGLPVRQGTNAAMTGPSSYELLKQRSAQKETETRPKP